MRLYGKINRFLFSRDFYLVKNLKPASTRFGYDRGTPIDRYWIELFLERNSDSIQGRCLEIGDNRYTQQYGKNVTVSDVLDINQHNKRATVVGDMKNLHGVIEDNTYNCIIVTQVFGMIDDVSSAIKECYRILKPGGVILVTMSSISPTYDIDHSFWRFTTTSARYLFESAFEKQNITIEGFGNAFAGQSFWIGLSKQDLTSDELNTYDSRYQCLVAVKGIKI